jgi:hypothetical protein
LEAEQNGELPYVRIFEIGKPVNKIDPEELENIFNTIP